MISTYGWWRGPYECELCDGTKEGMCVACRLRFARDFVGAFVADVERMMLEYESIEHFVRDITREHDTPAPVKAEYLIHLMNDVVDELRKYVRADVETDKQTRRARPR